MDKHLIKKELRESILNWYTFGKDSSLLEIGKKEDSLKPLFERRCKRVESVFTDDMDFCSDDSFSSVLGSGKYDYIVALGIPEITVSPEKTMQILSEHLTKDGILLTSFSNRYGLKYFCGAPDPYTGIVFDGMNNYLNRDMDNRPIDINENVSAGRCFSKNETETILKSVPGLRYKFYYPLPDETMPQIIMTDEFTYGTDVGQRLLDYTYADTRFGVTHRMMTEIVSGGHLSFLSNVFLIEATNGGCLSDMVYGVTTTDRGKDFGMATTIRKNRTVCKRPLWDEGKAQLEKLFANTKKMEAAGIPSILSELSEDAYGPVLTMPYVEITSLDSVLRKLVKTDTNRFEALFDRLFAYIQKSAKSAEDEILIDLTPINAIYTEETDEILFYDQEFSLLNVPPEFVIYRAIKYFYMSARDAEGVYPQEKLLARYGINEESVEQFEKIENDFINSVRSKDDNSILYRLATPDYAAIQKRIVELSKQTEKKPYKVGYVPGVFDLLHVGHLRLFERCKDRCEYLIVGVLTDELVEYYKARKPVISYADRARLIEALKVVDEVVPVDFSNTDKLDAWEQLHYDCHFSGDDHVNHWKDVWEELKKRGSNMEFFSYTEGISTTQIRETIKQ